MPALTDVPDRYDVVFSLNDGTKYGFLFADSVESNLPFRTHKALYSYSPTFLERQNLSQQYGDNFQDFFLTGSQTDFSEGERQKFFRVNDVDSVRKYWAGLNVDPILVPGNVTLTQGTVTVTTAAALSWLPGTQFTNGYAFFGANPAAAGHLYGVTGGTVTDLGAHGLGVSAGSIGMAQDGTSVYLTSENGGSVGVRKSVVGPAPYTFSTFSATKCTALVFLNNILYGWQASTDSLISFDTSGNPTTQFSWKGADATVNQLGPFIQMAAYGGSIYILRKLQTAELWVYDGSGCRKLADFSKDFGATSMCVSQGIVYVAGNVAQNSSGTTYKPQVYYYANGSIGKLWEAQSFGASSTGITIDAFGSGVVFQDTTNNNILQYDLALGGVHTISNPAAIVSVFTSNLLAEVLFAGSSTTSFVYPPASAAYNASGYIQTSQYDFDNTLNKIFRGIKVDVDLPANTSADIAYQIDGAGGSYTNLQTGAVSGTEYALPANTNGHSISVRVTLKSATGVNTPTLKRIYVRAAPILQQFRRREYLFDLSSGTRDELGKVSRHNRDMTAYPADAITAVNNLIKVATQTIPFTVADRFVPSPGMTVLADLQQNQAGYDGFAIYEVRPNVFIGRINLREV